MIRSKILLFLVVALAIGAFLLFGVRGSKAPGNAPDLTDENIDGGGLQEDSLAIDTLRKGQYPGSEIKIEQTLDSGSGYQRYIASYISEGNKVYALLTIPDGEKPDGGWPVIIFNHGYIPPAQYRTTERYVAYVDGFARNGYIVFKPDYRGHGDSEGVPSGGYGSNGYTIDVLNVVSSLKRLENVNSGKIGMWGHSMGGHVTLRVMVVSKDIKVGVIWAGVVGSYADLLNNWRRSNFTPPPSLPSGSRRWRQALVEKYGTPEQNPKFWDSISSTSFLADISGPVQLHHGTGDSSVPVEFSQKLESRMKDVGREVEFYSYSGDDHNLSANFSTAMQRSVAFFDKYLK